MRLPGFSKNGAVLDRDDDAAGAATDARAWLARIHGFGLDSSEKGHPPSKFARLFARCRALGKTPASEFTWIGGNPIIRASFEGV